MVTAIIQIISGLIALVGAATGLVAGIVSLKKVNRENAAAPAQTSQPSAQSAQATVISPQPSDRRRRWRKHLWREIRLSVLILLGSLAGLLWMGIITPVITPFFLTTQFVLASNYIISSVQIWQFSEQAERTFPG
jgi:hypothetical protein